MNIFLSLDGFYVFLSDMEINAMMSLATSSHLQLKTQLTLTSENKQLHNKKELNKLSNLIDFFSPSVVLGKNNLEFTGTEIYLNTKILNRWIQFQQEKIGRTNNETTLLFLNNSLNLYKNILKKFVQSKDFS